MSSGDKLHKKIIKKFPKGRSAALCVKRSRRGVVEALEIEAHIYIQYPRVRY